MIHRVLFINMSYCYIFFLGEGTGRGSRKKRYVKKRGCQIKRYRLLHRSDPKDVGIFKSALVFLIIDHLRAVAQLILKNLYSTA